MLTFAFMLSSLPCLYTFWHAIPTSFYTFNVLYFLFLYLFDVNLSYSLIDLSLRRFLSLSVTTTLELETA